MAKHRRELLPQEGQERGLGAAVAVPKGQESSAQGFNPAEYVPLDGPPRRGVRLRIYSNIKILCNHEMSQSLALVLVHIINPSESYALSEGDSLRTGGSPGLKHPG